MDFRYLVKNVRAKLEVNQYEFARIMGVDQSLVSKWENGIEKGTESRVFEMMYFYELFTGDNEATLVLFAPYVKSIVRRREGK